VARLNPAGGLEHGIRFPVVAPPDIFPAARSGGRASGEASQSGTMSRSDPGQVRLRPNRLDVCSGEDAEISENVFQRDVFLAGEGNNSFDRHVETYDSDLSPLSRKPLEFYCRYLKPGHRVLEIGCSSGRNLQYLRTQTGCVCFGIDPSEKAVRSGRDRFPNSQLSVGTAERLEFADGSFDFVLFGFCLCWIDRPLLSRVVAEADRVLKNRRFLGITDFDPPSPFVRPYKHRAGVNTYQMDYSKPFTVYPHYVLVEKLGFSHTSPGFAGDPQERLSSVVLYKDLDAGYERVE
jgi:ubiquinone/menaquinone biosynthesis C-methylase UbiE